MEMLFAVFAKNKSLFNHMCSEVQLLLFHLQVNKLFRYSDIKK